MTGKKQQDTREHLLAVGERIIHGKGFAAVGLAQILAEAGVPKGSFYHYFASKDAYGVALLERYFVQYHQHLAGLLVQGTGRQALLAYFAGWQTTSCQSSGGSRCLVVKLAGEVSDLSEAMRQQLDAGMSGVLRLLAAAVVAGREDGSIAAGLPAWPLATALYQQWLGAALLYKVQHNPALYVAAHEACLQLLGEPPATVA